MNEIMDLAEKIIFHANEIKRLINMDNPGFECKLCNGDGEIYDPYLLEHRECPVCSLEKVYIRNDATGEEGEASEEIAEQYK